MCHLIDTLDMQGGHCQENLKVFGNFTDIREMSGNFKVFGQCRALGK